MLADPFNKRSINRDKCIHFSANFFGLKYRRLCCIHTTPVEIEKKKKKQYLKLSIDKACISDNVAVELLRSHCIKAS